MKYRDPITGELKDVYVKASDTLPIGSTIEIPDDMSIPDGWEEVEEEWKNPTFINDWQSANSSNTVQYKKVGNIVYIRGSITKNRTISSNADKTVFILPIGYRPTRNLFGNQNGTPYNVYQTGEVLFGDINTFATGNWLTFDGLYFFVD